jgi:hypothetical protein
MSHFKSDMQNCNTQNCEKFQTGSALDKNKIQKCHVSAEEKPDNCETQMEAPLKKVCWFYICSIKSLNSKWQQTLYTNS